MFDFQQLNDDCQLAIMSHLDTNDLLSLWEASNGISTRLNINLLQVWSRQPNHNSNNKTQYLLEKYPELLELYFTNICSTVKKVDFLYITLKHLEFLQPYTFLNVNNLNYILSPHEVELNSNSVLALLVKLFPNIRTCKAYGYIDCQNFTNWKQLRSLHLGKCLTGHTAKYLINCNELEELLYCPYLNKSKFSSLLRLPKLQTLSFKLKPEVLYWLIKLRGLDIYHINFENSIYKCSRKIIEKLKKLRHLTIGKPNHMENVLFDLPFLEELHLLDDNGLNLVERRLWQIVACYPNLKILNILGMRIKDKFFELHRLRMNKVLNHRTVPLVLNIQDNDDSMRIIRKKFKHPNLQLTFKQLNIERIQSGRLLAKFTPYDGKVVKNL